MLGVIFPVCDCWTVHPRSADSSVRIAVTAYLPGSTDSACVPGGKLFTILVVAVATSTPAYGQTTSAAREAPESAWRFGAVRLAPAVTLADVGWDSNVLLENADQHPEGDFTSTFRPEIDAWLRVGLVRFRGGSAFDFVYFKNYPDERSIDRAYGGRVDVPLAFVTPYASVRWLSAKQRFGYEIDDRIRRDEATQVSGVEVRLSPATRVDVAARRTRLEFDDADGIEDPLVSELYDYTSRGVTVAVRHELTPLTTVGVILDAHRERFDLDPTRDSETVGVQSGVEFKPSAVISGNAYVGWSRIELMQPGSSSFRGLAASIDLAYTLLGATRFIVQAERDVSYSAIRGQHAYLLAGLTGTVKHRLGDRWEIGGRTGRHTLSYGVIELPQQSGGEDESQQIDDREIVWEYGSEVGYRVGPATRLAVRLEHQERRSTVDRTRHYEYLRVGTTVTYQF